MSEPEFPGAVAPERSRFLEIEDVRLHLHEWGDPERAPLILCHGMFDHGRGFDLLAPLLSSHFRVIAIDARGHGESSWVDSYAWPLDVADIVRVVSSLGRPAHLLGHSKGGGQVTDAAVLAGDRIRQVVNIDGFGPPPDDFDTPRRHHHEGPLPERFAQFLDNRRRTASQRAWRAYPSLDELVKRRKRQNPRLSEEWLRYFLYFGSQESEDGWRWKVDPHVAQGFGPWRADWIGPVWKRLHVPLLAVIGSEPDTWGPLPEALLEERLSYVAKLERVTVEGTGHFVHMERPEATAEQILAWLDR